jgi:mannose-1-phosphate guanylyltransferase
VLQRALRQLDCFGMKVELKKEPRPLGTGGAIRFAWPDPEKPCLVLNGDILSDFQISRFISAHRKSRALASLWVIPVDDPSQYGVVEHDGQGRVRRFVEKPRPGESDSRWINAGLYLLEPKVWTLIPAGMPCSVEREVFPNLLKAGRPVMAFREAKAYWRDIGTPQNYLQANQDVVAGKLKLGRAGSFFGKITPAGNLIAAGSPCPKNASVVRSVIGPGCRIKAGAVIEESVILAGCRVGSGSVIQGSVLGAGCRVGDQVRLAKGSLLAGRSALLDHSSILL